MRKMFILAAALLLVAAPAFALGGSAGFARTSFQIDGDEITALTNPTAGLSFVVPMDESAPGAGDETYGFEFGTKFLSDQGIRNSTLNAGMYRHWQAVVLVGSLQLDFLEVDDEIVDSPLTETTKLLGVNGGIRWNASGLPAEFGGSYSYRYDGMEEVSLSEVHLGLVFDGN